MSSVDGLIRTALQDSSELCSLVKTRVYLSVAPQSAAAPRIIYYRAGGGPLQSLGGGLSTYNWNYEVLVVAETVGEARHIAALATVALNGFSRPTTIGSCSLVSEEDGVIPPEDESGAGLRTVTQTYSIWGSS